MERTFVRHDSTIGTERSEAERDLRGHPGTLAQASALIPAVCVASLLRRDQPSRVQ
jgi:hypothetical protein